MLHIIVAISMKNFNKDSCAVQLNLWTLTGAASADIPAPYAGDF